MSTETNPETKNKPISLSEWAKKVKESFLKRITTENIDATHDKLLEVLLPGMIADHINRYKFAAEQYKQLGLNQDNSHFLDLASGQGYGMNILNDALDGKGSFIGVELNLKSIKKAQSEYPIDNNGGYIQGNVTSLPLPDGAIDGVTAFEIFEHIPADKQGQMLSEIYRVLKPGGSLVLSIPHPYSQKPDGTKHIGSNVFHLSELPPERLKEMLTEAGFEEPLEGRPAEYGQLFMPKQDMDAMIELNTKLPIYPLTWASWSRNIPGIGALAHAPSEFEVVPKPVGDEVERVAFTSIFEVRKPLSLT